MTEKIPGLMGFVIRALKDDPDVSSSELHERSRSRYPEVENMTVRQFHARYPLQARKQLNQPVVRLFPVPKADPPPEVAAAAPSAPEEPAEPSKPPREALRTLLFKLAMDMETAHSRADVVDVVSRMGRYVDEAMAITGASAGRRGR